MKKNLQMWIIVIALLILYAVSTLIVLLNPSRSELFTFLRLCGVLGLLSLGLAVIIVPFAAQLYQIFGKTFLKIHHLFAVLGVVLLTLHPVALFILTLNPLIFLPAFDSFISFWNLAGRPALILIYIGVLAALLRNYLKNSWKKFHALLYIAYIFGLIHGILIGTDFKNPFILILFSTLTILIVFTFIIKRIRRYKITQKKKQ